MKQITDLYNKHLGQVIWICGSDPTIDGYPDNFLDNKIGITLHLAYFKFFRATYRHFNEYDRLNYCIQQDSSILKKKNIVAQPFYRRTEEESNNLTNQLKKAYFFNLVPYPPNGNPLDIFEEIGVKAMKEQVIKAREGTLSVIGDYGTCAHASLYTAILMGGNPIYIIGTGFKSAGNQEHYSKVDLIDKQMRPSIELFSNPNRTKRMFAGTNAIIEGCKEIGIKIIRFENYEQYLVHINSGI